MSQDRSVKRTRLVRTDRLVVAVEVDAVIPGDDPSDACYGPEVVELLREVERRAIQGDVEWLSRRGRVYRAVEVA